MRTHIIRGTRLNLPIKCMRIYISVFLGHQRYIDREIEIEIPKNMFKYTHTHELLEAPAPLRIKCMHMCVVLATNDRSREIDRLKSPRIRGPLAQVLAIYI